MGQDFCRVKAHLRRDYRPVSIILSFHLPPIMMINQTITSESNDNEVQKIQAQQADSLFIF